MSTRKPLILVSGLYSELPPGDVVPGIDSVAQASGNAALSLANTALASGNLGISNAAIALASGNAALVNAGVALASGNAALVNAGVALASGNAALTNSATALASGNAALSSLSAKYDKSGGLISGAVTVNAQVVGSQNYIIASGVILLNFGTSNNFEIVLTSGTQTLANPINPSGGQTGTIVVRQDGTGSRLLVYSGGWQFPNGTAPTLTTTASGVDVISYYCVNPNRINAAATLNYGSGTVA